MVATTWLAIPAPSNLRRGLRCRLAWFGFHVRPRDGCSSSWCSFACRLLEYRLGQPENIAQFVISKAFVPVLVAGMTLVGGNCLVNENARLEARQNALQSAVTEQLARYDDADASLSFSGEIYRFGRCSELTKPNTPPEIACQHELEQQLARIDKGINGALSAVNRMPVPERVRSLARDLRNAYYFEEEQNVDEEAGAEREIGLAFLERAGAVRLPNRSIENEPSDLANRVNADLRLRSVRQSYVNAIHGNPPDLARWHDWIEHGEVLPESDRVVRMGLKWCNPSSRAWATKRGSEAVGRFEAACERSRDIARVATSRLARRTNRLLCLVRSDVNQQMGDLLAFQSALVGGKSEGDGIEQLATLLARFGDRYDANVTDMECDLNGVPSPDGRSDSGLVSGSDRDGMVSDSDRDTRGSVSERSFSCDSDRLWRLGSERSPWNIVVCVGGSQGR